MRRYCRAPVLILGLLLAAPLPATQTDAVSTAGSAAQSAADPAEPHGPAIEPGLWESTRGGDLEGLMAAQMAEAEAELQALPEAQQAAIRATMAAQLADLAKSRRTCMSADQARHFWRDQLRDATCRRTITWTGPGQGQMIRHCEHDRVEKTAITVVDDGRQISMVLSGTTASGKPIDLTMSLRRVGDSCGPAKPR